MFKTSSEKKKKKQQFAEDFMRLESWDWKNIFSEGPDFRCHLFS